MKTCQACGLAAEDTAATCAACGQASWRDAPKPEPLDDSAGDAGSEPIMPRRSRRRH